MTMALMSVLDACLFLLQKSEGYAPAFRVLVKQVIQQLVSCIFIVENFTYKHSVSAQILLLSVNYKDTMHCASLHMQVLQVFVGESFTSVAQMQLFAHTSLSEKQ